MFRDCTFVGSGAIGCIGPRSVPGLLAETERRCCRPVVAMSSAQQISMLERGMITVVRSARAGSTV
jgi:hypothetical protein